MIRFHVPGIPVGQGSKRHVGKGIMVESSANLKPWRDSIISAVLETWPDDNFWMFVGPVAVSLEFNFPRPKSHYGTGRNSQVLKPGTSVYKHSKPDLDKLVRAALDAITQSGAIWQDDSQVAELVASKEYGRPGLLVTVDSVREP